MTCDFDNLERILDLASHGRNIHAIGNVRMRVMGQRLKCEKCTNKSHACLCPQLKDLIRAIIIAVAR